MYLSPLQIRTYRQSSNQPKTADALYQELEKTVSPSVKLESETDFFKYSDFVTTGMNEEVSFLSALKRVAIRERNVESLTNIAGRRLQALSLIFKIAETKFDFLLKNKMKLQSENVVSDVIEYIMQEIRKIASDAGNPKFFSVLCKELDQRLPIIEEMIAAQVEARIKKVQ